MTPSESGKLGALAWQKSASLIRQSKIAEYSLSPVRCKKCNVPLDFDKRKNAFCSKSCSGSFTGLEKSKNILPKSWECISCNKTHLRKVHKVGKFCNVKCQQVYLNNARIEEWKRTGVISNIDTPAWIKRYILDKQDGKCASCGITDWNGKPLVFDLEHIDGNSENNKETNLCCLCPNCHSQTPTYKAKNKGNGRAKRRKQNGITED